MIRKFRRASRSAIPIAIASALLLAGCSGTEVVAPASPSAAPAIPDDLRTFYEQPARWHNCGDADCTTIEVPLDYANPGAGSTTLNMTRVRKGDGELGSLLINPGGPGNSAFDFAKAGTAVVNASVLDHYDLIGVDPRGVGHSAPVHCLTEVQKDEFAAADATPDSSWEGTLAERVAHMVRDGCTASMNPLIAHMSTQDAARDLDIVRAVLGDPVLNYLGKSWGTYLGATYAELFPERVGRMVLDGVLDAGSDLATLTHDQAVAFEASLANFVQWCAANGDCPLAGSTEEGVQEIREFLKALDRTPIKDDHGRELTEALATNAILASLYLPSERFPGLRDALASAMKGDPALLLALQDAATGRDARGHYANNSTDAFYVYTCTDRPWSGTASDAADLGEAWKVDAPTFGPALATGLLVCADWLPQGTARTPTAISTDAPMLIVAGTHDPATPPAWGEKLAKDLPNAHLITVDTWSHTAYSWGNACLDDQVDAYLLAGKLPVQSTC